MYLERLVCDCNRRECSEMRCVFGCSDWYIQQDASLRSRSCIQTLERTGNRMETQINSYEGDRQRRSNLRQIEVVGGGESAIQRLFDGRKQEVGKRRRNQTPTTGIHTQQPENTRTLVNYSSQMETRAFAQIPVTQQGSGQHVKRTLHNIHSGQSRDQSRTEAMRFHLTKTQFELRVKSTGLQNLATVPYSIHLCFRCPQIAKIIA